MTDRLLSLRQVAERLGCSYEFVYRAYRRGTLPVIKQGRFVRVSESDLLLWIGARRIAVTIISETEGRRKARTERERALGLVPASDIHPPQSA